MQEVTSKASNGGRDGFIFRIIQCSDTIFYAAYEYIYICLLGGCTYW